MYCDMLYLFSHEKHNLEQPLSYIYNVKSSSFTIITGEYMGIINHCCIWWISNKICVANLMPQCRPWMSAFSNLCFLFDFFFTAKYFIPALWFANVELCNMYISISIRHLIKRGVWVWVGDSVVHLGVATVVDDGIMLIIVLHNSVHNFDKHYCCRNTTSSTTEGLVDRPLGLPDYFDCTAIWLLHRQVTVDSAWWLLVSSARISTTTIMA